MKRALFCLTLSGLVLAGFSCATSAKPPVPPVTAPVSVGSKDVVTIMAPKDETAYVNAIDRGGADPSVAAKFYPFVAKQVPVTVVSPDPTSAALQAAASELKAGPAGADKVVYFKVVGKTAYVLLEMDVNGWAGVSFAIAKVHPLVEQTLLQMPDITAVKFDVAPGDSRTNLQ